MAHFHFHAADGAKFRDLDGEDLPDLEAAKAVAVEILAEMLPGKSDVLWKHKTFGIYVKDEQGRLVAVLTTVATLDPFPGVATPRPGASPDTGEAGGDPTAG